MKEKDIINFEIIVNQLYLQSKKVAEQLKNDSDLRFLRWAETWLIVRNKNGTLSLDKRLLKELKNDKY